MSNYTQAAPSARRVRGCASRTDQTVGMWEHVGIDGIRVPAARPFGAAVAFGPTMRTTATVVGPITAASNKLPVDGAVDGAGVRTWNPPV